MIDLDFYSMLYKGSVTISFYIYTNKKLKNLYVAQSYCVFYFLIYIIYLQVVVFNFLSVLTRFRYLKIIFLIPIKLVHITFTFNREFKFQKNFYSTITNLTIYISSKQNYTSSVFSFLNKINSVQYTT